MRHAESGLLYVVKEDVDTSRTVRPTVPFPSNIRRALRANATAKLDSIRPETLTRFGRPMADPYIHPSGSTCSS
jgi:hypothetical protein